MKIGDIVRVTNVGGVYTTYPEWVKNSSLPIEEQSKYRMHVEPSTQKFYILRCIEPHGSFANTEVAYISDKENGYMMNTSCLEKVEVNNILELLEEKNENI